MGREHSHALQHPVNLCCLAGYVRPHGFRPRIADFEVDPWSEEAFRRLLSDFRPRLIAFNAMTPTIDAAARMARVATDALPGASIVAGGPHTSILPRHTLENYSAIDAVVMGEGEQAFLDICLAVREERLGDSPTPSALIRRGAEIIGDEADRHPPLDLDSLPPPARDLLDMKKYSGAPTPGIPWGGDRATQLFTARGCPGRCIFCCSEHVFGRRVRTRSAARVLDEVRDCMSRFGIRHFTIDNDTFTYDRDFVIEFCRGMSQLDATWDCDTRVDRVDDELLETMARSGCLKVAFGVETGSERILKLIKKGITLEQVEKAFRGARRAGMLSCAFLMLGNHPEETEADIDATRRLVRRIRPDLISVALATPYPGTRLRDLMLEEGLLDESRPWSDYGQSFQGKPFIRTKTVSAERLLELQTLMLRGFYLRPEYILKRLAGIRGGRELRYWFGAGIGFIQYLLGRR